MAEGKATTLQYQRPEFAREVHADGFGVVEKPLTALERVYNNVAIRKASLLVLLAILWEAYARWLDSPLLFPTFIATLQVFSEAMVSGELPARALFSLGLLMQGYVAGLALAAILTTLANVSRVGTDLLELLTSMFNPLPSIALLPLALIWFGLGNGSLVFVLIHAVLWPVALNTHTGFNAVSQTLRMVGGNYGLRGPRYIFKILIPAAFPSILTGLKIGWAFAWRTLVAAELVFGVSSGSGGVGWYIYKNKNDLEIPAVFAGLFTVILIGLLVESIIFANLEKATVRRWGMQS